MRRRSVWLVVILAIVVVLPTCTDRDIVGIVFPDPAPGANDFLGYQDVEEQLTVCGNCHAGKQADWVTTAHAGAWETLQEAGSQPFCEGCHTVNQRGNPTVEEGGYATVAEPRYQDVQCESCHGPGFPHIQEPGSFQPLASLAVGLDLTTGCGECHQGNHHGFVDDWAQSKHAQPWGEFFPGGVNAGAAAALRPECQACHLGQGVLAAWGEEDSYIEADAPATSDQRLPITCGVCHDPHGSDNQSQLRFPINVASAEEHLCARCHNRNTSPNPESSHGLEPHAPETALLQGDVGWFPPGINIDRGEIIATHGTGANPGLCATCHVNSFDVVDQETGDFVFKATGHTFQPMPCVDDEGVPVGGDCVLSTAARSFRGCTASGCHGTEQAAFSALSTATNRILLLAEELHDLLVQVDPGLTDAGGEIDPNNPTFTVAEGAFFNLAVAEFPERDRPDPRLLYAGAAAHNPFLTEQLLIASIRAVEDEYGVSASPDVGLDRRLIADR